MEANQRSTQQRKPAAPVITKELATFLQYVFIKAQGGREPGALPLSTVRGHAKALKQAQEIGAVKVIESTKYGKPKKFWVLTDAGKRAVAELPL